MVVIGGTGAEEFWTELLPLSLLFKRSKRNALKRCSSSGVRGVDEESDEVRDTLN